MQYWVLDRIFNKPSSPRHMEYLAVDENFFILDSSEGITRFADSPDEVGLGKDVRLSFPELIGVEDTLIDILSGKNESFDLKGIARSLVGQPTPLYIDIYCLSDREEIENRNRLLILIEDTTERMVLEQTLVQRVNEANLLSSALAASRDYIDKIIISMADALLVTSLSGKIKRVNPAAINLFGYEEAELINQHISDIIIDNNFSIEENQQYLLATKEVIENIDLLCQNKTGNRIIVGFSCSAIQTDIEEFQEFVYVGRDITDRKSAEEEMRHSLAKERELNELKSRFVSMVSHEFGNPLNRILLAVELLQDYNAELTEQEKSEYLYHIRSATEEMGKLLNDVLLIGKAEAGKIEFNPSPIDLVKFCNDLIEQVKMSGGGYPTINFVYHGLPVSGKAANELPSMDRKLLQTILVNLLSNAIKYSPQSNPIELKLTCENGQAIWEVKDQGIGIPPEDLEKLFATFHRAKNVGKIPGTGLGLAIVKQSVDVHGGEIRVESQVGIGTKFTVILPLNQINQTDLE